MGIPSLNPLQYTENLFLFITQGHDVVSPWIVSLRDYFHFYVHAFI